MNTIFTRNIRILVTALILSLVPVTLMGQNNCSAILSKAEELFDQGIIEEIPALLENCIRDGFTGEERLRARKLIILSYIFDNKIIDAESKMLSFLRSHPEYELEPGDPSEFASLFSSYRTVPFLSAGVFAGGNLTAPSLLEQYGPYNPDISPGELSITSPQYQAGFAINFFLNEKLEANLETIYARSSFSYSNLQYGFAETSRKETHSRIEFPVSVTYDIIGEQWKPYVRVGGSYGLILSAYGDYRRSGLPVETTQGIFETNDVDLSNRRYSSTLSAMLGGGVKYKIPRGYLYLDLRYFYGLSKVVKPSTRWDQETVFSFYQADEDFQIDYLAFSIGFRYSFFRSFKIN